MCHFYWLKHKQGTTDTRVLHLVTIIPKVIELITHTNALKQQFWSMYIDQWLFDGLVNTFVEPKPEPICMVKRAANNPPNPTNAIPNVQ